MSSWARLTFGSISRSSRSSSASSVGQLGRLGVLRRALGGVGDDLDVALGQLLVRRLVEVGELLGHLDAALPAHRGHLAHLVQVAAPPRSGSCSASRRGSWRATSTPSWYLRSEISSTMRR